MNRFVPSNVRLRRASIAIWDIAAWFLATTVMTISLLLAVAFLLWRCWNSGCSPQRTDAVGGRLRLV